MADSAAALLNTIKSYLHITWQDDQTDALINGYIARGQQRLNSIAGVTLDFSAEGLPLSLLLDYCRYANSQALEVFEHNFQSELLELHLQNQAPIIGDLAIIAIPGPDGILIRVAPALAEEDSYLVKAGADLSVPASAAICTPPAWSEWDGVSPVAATSGQQIVVAEVDDSYRAVRAGMVTVP